MTSSAAACEHIDHLRVLGRYTEAERATREALAGEPQDPELLWRLGSILLGDHRPAEALAAADAALAGAPDDPDVHRTRALVLSELNRHDEAVAAAAVAASGASTHAGTAIAASVVLERAGRLPEAWSEANRAVTLAPQSPATHFRVGNLAIEAGDIRTARQAYAEVLRLDPAHAEAQHNLALTDVRTRHPGRALSGLVAAGRLDPTMPEVLRTVAAVLWQLAYRLRVGLIVTVVITIGVVDDIDQPRTAVRVVAGVVILATLGYTWWGARRLPPQTRTVVLAAARTDPMLILTWAGIALCVAVYVVVAVTGIAVLAAYAWPVLIGLGVVSVIVGAVRNRRARRR